jgi:hypothetical protein
MAIAAPDQMDLVPISDWRMPSFVLLIATTLSQQTLVIISVVTLMILTFILPGKMANICSLLCKRQLSLLSMPKFLWGTEHCLISATE